VAFNKIISHRLAVLCLVFLCANFLGIRFVEADCLDTATPMLPASSTPSPTRTDTLTWVWVNSVGSTYTTSSFRYEINNPPVGGASTTTNTPVLTSTFPASSASHTLYMQQQCNPGGSWSPSGILTLSIDLTGPSKPSLKSETIATNVSTPIWTWTSAGDGAEVFQVKLRSDDPPVAPSFSEGDLTTTVLSFTSSTALSDRIHTLWVLEEDSLGNLGTLTYFSIQIDTVPPLPSVVSGTTPTNSDQPKWDIDQGGGDGINSFRYKLDDDDFSSGTTLLNLSFFQPTSGLTEATHTLYVQERDSVGNWSTTANHSIVIDLTAPTSPIVTVATPNQDGFPTFIWASSDVSGNGVFEYRLFDSGSQPTGDSVTDSSTTFTTGIQLPDGSYQLQVKEFDSAGNSSGVGTIDVSVSSALSAAPSVLGPSSPTNNTTVNWTWSSNTGRTNFAYNIDDSNLAPPAGTTTTDLSLQQVLAEGTHTLFVVDATDGFGSNSSATGFHSVIIDLTPPNAPSVSVSSPTSDLTPSFTWTTNGGGSGSFRYELSPPGNNELSSGSTATTNLNFTTGSALSDGDYTLYVEEQDAAGNWSSSGSALVAVDTFVPTPTYTGPFFTNDTTPVWTWISGGSDGNGTFRYKFEDSDLSNGATSTTQTSATTAIALEPGGYTLYVQERDALQNWSAPGSFTLTVDTLAPNSPSVTGTTPTSETKPTWNWSSGGNGDGSDFRYKFEDSNLDTGATTVAATTFTTATPLTDGVYTLFVQESDTAGNWSLSGSHAISVDTSAPSVPSVSVTNPTSDSTPTFTWTSNEAVAFRYKLDNASLVSGAISTIALTFTTATTLPDGEHTLYVQGRDSAGNWSTTGTAIVTVDTFVPVPVYTGPGFTNDTTPVWTWASGGSDGNGTFRYKFEDSDLSNGATSTTQTSATTAIALEPGGYTLYVQERDALQNWSAPGSFTLTVDTLAPNSPSVTGTTPTSQTTPTWNWSSGGNGDGSNFRYKFEDSNLDTGATTVVATTFTTATPLTDGVYTLFVQESDTAGNWSLSGSLAISVDTSAPSAPSVNVTNPTSDSTPTFTWTSNGGVEFRYKMDDAALATGAISTTSLSFTTATPLLHGEHIFYIEGRDVAGNWSVFSSAIVTIDTIPPLAPDLSGTTLTNDATPSWTWVGRGGGNGTFRYKLNDSSLESGAISSSGSSYTTATSLLDGTHTFYIEERDGVGNWSATSSFATLVDTGPPSAPSFTATTLTSDTTPTWTWTGDGSGDGIGLFRYKFQDSSLETGATSTLALALTTSTPLLDGTYTLYVQESDGAGNWSSSGNFIISVDLIAPGTPSVVVSSPTSDSTPTFFWTPGGGDGTGDYRYELSPPGDLDLTSGAISVATTSFTTGVTLEDGNFTLSVQERDQIGNWSVSGTAVVAVDITTPPLPSVSGTTPTSDSTPLWTLGSGTGSDGIGTFRYKIDDSDLSSGAIQTSSTGVSPTLSLVDGSHTLYLEERDAAGNWSDPVSFTLVVDTTVPTPSVLASTPTSDDTPTWFFASGGGDGNGSFRFKLDDAYLANGATQTTATSFTASPLPDNPYTLYVQERDNLGNWSSSGSFTLSVNTTSPANPLVTGLSPTNNSRPTWTWGTGGSGGSGNYRHKFDNNDLSFGAISTTQTGFTTGFPLLGGDYTLYVQERNAVHNWSDSGSFQITVDLTPPNAPDVVGTTPTSSQTPTWTWSGDLTSGSGVYRYSLDDSDLSTGATETITASFNEPLGLNDGNHTLYVQERDVAGNWSPSGAFTILIQSGAPNVPSVQGISPTTNTFPIWTWSSGGGSGNGNFRFKLNDSSLENGAIETTGLSHSVATSQADGSYTLYVQERNTAGLWSGSGAFTIVIDTPLPSSPSISGQTPTSSSKPTWTWIGGGGGNGFFRFKLNDSDLSAGATLGSVMEFTSLLTLGDGSHTLYVQEKNALGLWSASGSFLIDVDTTPPTAPSVGGTTPTTSQTPTWTWSGDLVSGSGNFRYKLNDADLNTGSTPITGFVLTPSLGLNDGTHTLYVQERDAAGNWSDSGSFQITVESGAPNSPSVLAFSPTTNSRPKWTWVSGGGGNGSFRYQLDNSNLESGAAQTISTGFIPLFDLSDGTHTLYVQEQNIVNTWSASGFSTVVIDSISPNPPSVSSISPTSDDRPSWTWVSGGNGGSGNFRYKLDDADLNSGATQTTNLFFSSGSSLGEGLHTLYVQERDSTGNWSPTGSFQITVDLTAPNLPSVSGDSVTTDSRPTWTWFSGGGFGNGSFRYKLDNSDLSTGATLTNGFSFTEPLGVNDGNHTLYVQERDDAGNWSDSGEFLVLVQSTAPNAPSVQGITPTTDPTPTWTWTSGGGSGNGTFRYKLDNSSLEGGATETTVLSFTPNSSLLDGSHTLYVEERNLAGLWSGTGSFTVIIDNSIPNPPSVFGTTPTSNAKPTWTWTSGGGGDGNFRYKLDDNILTTGAILTANLQFTSLLTLSEGSHILYVQEKNGLGLWSSSGSFPIEVDITPPTAPSVSGVTPTSNQAPTWTWATGGGGNGSYRLKLNDPVLTVGASFVSGTAFTPSPDLNDGTHTLYVQEKDSAGNWSNFGSFQITVQSGAPNAPSVVVLSPTTNSRPSWSWVSGGGGGNGSFRYQLDNSNLESGAAQTTSTGFIPLFDLSDGSHTLFVQEQKNVNTWSASGFSTVVIDSISPNPPSVNSISPTSDDRPTWTWVSGGNGGSGNFRYKLDDADLNSGATQTTNLFFSSGSALGEGLYTLYVQERDSTGNWSPTGSFQVSIDLTPPNSPSVSGVTPTTDSRPTWTWLSGGGFGNGSFRFKLDNSDLSTGATLTNGFSFTEPLGVNDGNHTLYVQERDDAENWSDSGSFTVLVQTGAPNAPSVLGITPTSDPTPTWFWSSGGGAGNGVFRYKLDDSNLSGGSTEVQGTSFTPQSDLVEGAHTLYVQERNSADLWSPSGLLAIIVDTQGPFPPSLSGSPVTSQTTPTWLWTSGGGGAGLFRYKFEDSDLSAGSIATTGTIFTTSSSLDDGPYSLFIQEQDSAGNWSSIVSLTLTVDTSAPAVPSISGTSPTSNQNPTWTWASGGGGNGTFRYKLEDSDLSSGATETADQLFTSPATLNDGNHILYVQEQDDAGNWSSSGNFTILVNSGAPDAPSVSGLAYTSATTPVWTWVAGIGGNGVFRYKLNDSNLATGATTTITTSFTPSTSLVDGTYTFYVQESDSGGLWSASGFFTTVVDTLAPNFPTVNAISPINVSTPTWTWVSNGGGDGIFRYKFEDSSLDNGAVSTLATSFTTALSLPDGAFTLFVQESDLAGNWSVNGSFTLTVDLIAPSAPQISGSTLTSDNTPTWIWTPQGGGSGNFRYKVDDSDLSSAAVTTISTAFTPRQALIDGSHSFYLQEQDSAGNWSATTTFLTVVDTSVPQPPLVQGPAATNNQLPTWTWSGQGGGIGVFRFSLDVNGFTGVAETNATSFTATSDLAEGTHILYVQERNLAGTWSTTASFSILVDTTPPSAPSVSGSSSTSDRTPLWTWTAQGGGSGLFRYELDDFDLSSGATETSNLSFSPSVDLNDGSYLLSVQERDTAGNWSTSGSFIVQVDATPPLPPVLSGDTPVFIPTPTWTWSGGGGGNGAFRYKLDDPDLSSGSTLTTDEFFTPQTGLNDGDYTLYVQERDDLGNWSPSASFVISVLSGAPNAPIVLGTTPTNDGFHSWTWTSGGGTGSGLYRFDLDNSNLASNSITTTVLSFTPLVALSDGSHTLYVQESNSQGLWSISGLFTITVDTSAPQAPSVTGTTPTSDDTPTWTWISQDFLGSGVFRYKLNDADLESGAFTTSETSFTPSAPLANTTHTLFVQERDTSGNWSLAGNFAIDVDTSSPGSPLVSIATGPTDNTPTWTWTSGGEGVGTYRFKLDSPDLSSGAIVLATQSYTEPLGLNDGPHILYVQERDQAGNWSASGSSIVSVNTGAPNHPVLAGVSPTSSSSPTWTWISGGGGGSGLFRYKLDDNDLDSGGTQTGGLSFTPTLALSEGTHTLYVQEQNSVGTWSVLGFLDIIIDLSAPSLPLLTAVSPTVDPNPTWTWVSGGGGNGIYRFKLNDSDLSNGANLATTTVFTSVSSLISGTHTLFVQESDDAGNWSGSAFLAVVVDLDPPSAPAVSSTTLTTSPNPLWSWTSGGGGVGIFRYKLDDPNLESGAVETLNLGFTAVSGLNDGPHTLYVQERDFAGNWSPTGSFTVTVDTGVPDAPAVNISSPTNNLRPTWTWLQATGAGAGNGTYRYKLDNTALASGATETSALRFTPSSDLTPGTHTLYVQEQDNAGLWSVSGLAVVILDITPPAIPEVSGRTPTNSTTLSWIWNPSGGGNGVFRHKLDVNDLSDGATQTTSLSLDQIVLVDGEHTLFVQEQDAAGNWSGSGSFAILLDTIAPIAPSVSGDSPTTSQNPIWTWNGDPGSGSGIFRFKLNDSDLASGSTETSRLSFAPIQGLNDGDHTLFVQERDLAGNWSSSGSFLIEVDTGAPDFPVVTGVTPTNIPTPKWTWLSGGGGGSGGFRYKLDDANLQQGSTETTETEFTPTSNLTEGSHSLFVQEKNDLGLWSANGSFTILIDTAAPTAPSVAGFSPTSNVLPTWTWSASGGGIGIFRYKLDDSALGTGAITTTSVSLTVGTSLIDGFHILYVQETDLAGNWSESGSFSIEVDTQAPAAPIFLNTERLSITPQPTWQWISGDIVDGSGVYRYVFVDTSAPVDDSDFTDGSIEIPVGLFKPDFPLDDDTYFLYVQERDEVGNWSPAQVFDIQIETNRPQSPSVTGVVLTTNVRPTWSWTQDPEKGNGIFRYELVDLATQELSNAAVHTTSQSWTPVSALSDGSHKLCVQEQNDEEDWSASGCHVLVIDTTPPSPPTITGDPQTNDPTPTWTWSGNGNGVFRYQFVNFDTNEDLSGGFIETTETSFTPSTNLADANYRVFVMERDDAGNFSATAFLIINLNTLVPSAPSVVASFLVTNDPTPEWTWVSTDFSGSGKYRLMLDSNTFTGTSVIEPATGTTSFSPSDPLPDGLHTLFVREFNVFGTESGTSFAELLVDTKVPLTSLEPLPGLYNEIQSLTLNCLDGGSGCAATHFTTVSTLPDLSSTIYTQSLTVTETTTFAVFSVDLVGNQEAVQIVTYVIDLIRPVSTASPRGGVHQAGTEVVISCQDAIACGSTYFTVDGSVPTLASQTVSTPITLTSNLILQFFSMDIAGNKEFVVSEIYQVDSTSPVTFAIPTGGIYSAAQTITLSCIDDSLAPCSAIHFTLDGSNPDSSSEVYSSPLALQQDSFLRFFGLDHVGNRGEITTEFYTIIPFVLNVHTVYLEPGESYPLSLTGAVSPRWSLQDASLGTLLNTTAGGAVFLAPLEAAVATVIVSEVLAGTLVEDRVEIRIVSPLEILDASGARVIGTAIVQSGDRKLTRFRGGGSQFELSLISAPVALSDVNLENLGDGSFAITAPTSGSFAGNYHYLLSELASGFTTSFDFQVPLKLIVSSVNILGGATENLTILGGRSGDPFRVRVLRGDNGAEDLQSNLIALGSSPVSQLDPLGGNPASLSFTAREQSKITSFIIEVIPEDRTDLAPQRTLPLRIFPSTTYRGRILSTQGSRPVSGARVRALYLDTGKIARFALSDSEGEFELRLPIRPVGLHQLVVEKDQFISAKIPVRNFQEVKEREYFAPVALQVAEASISGSVQGLEEGDEAQIFAVSINSRGRSSSLGPFTLIGSGSHLDAFTFWVDRSVTYQKLTLRSRGFLSEVNTRNNRSFPMGLGNISGIDFSLRKVRNFTIVRAISEFPLVLVFSDQDSDLSGYSIESKDVLGQEVLPVLSTSGLDRVASFETDQDLSLRLRSPQGEIVLVFSHFTESPPPELPQGQEEVAVKGGFQVVFEPPEGVEPGLISQIRVELPADGIREERLGGAQAVSFLEVYTHNLLFSSGAAQSTGQKIVEINLNILTSNGVSLSLGKGNNILNELLLTLPFDPQVTLPGDLESGKVSVFSAEDVSQFLGGSLETIAPSQILAVDYLNSLVTFRVVHLSVFGMGTVPPSAPTVGGGSPQRSCFIATAAFGSSQRRLIDILCQFRDEFLMRTRTGKQVMDFYYSVSPRLADGLREHETWRGVIRLCLYPLILIAWFMIFLKTFYLAILGLAGLLGLIFLLRRCFSIG
jgi:large repetitive protein